MDLKTEISRIIKEALSGRVKRYRTENDYIKWELVKKDILKAVDAVSKPE